MKERDRSREEAKLAELQRRSRKAGPPSSSCRSSARRCAGSSSSSTSCCASCRRGATRRTCCAASARSPSRATSTSCASRPGNFSDQDFYSEWPIEISSTGTYHNLALFFDRISRFSRIINIENLQVSAPAAGAQGPHTITASFIAKTFVYKETPPPAPAAARRRPRVAAATMRRPAEARADAEKAIMRAVTALAPCWCSRLACSPAQAPRRRRPARRGAGRRPEPSSPRDRTDDRRDPRRTRRRCWRARASPTIRATAAIRSSRCSPARSSRSSRARGPRASRACSSTRST